MPYTLQWVRHRLTAGIQLAFVGSPYSRCPCHHTLHRAQDRRPADVALTLIGFAITVVIHLIAHLPRFATTPPSNSRRSHRPFHRNHHRHHYTPRWWLVHSPQALDNPHQPVHRSHYQRRRNSPARIQVKAPSTQNNSPVEHALGASSS